MNKIICDVCGTDYPETAAQCPICGCASAGAQTAAGKEMADTEEKAYTPVKGGRYSKANVRKRLKANQIPYDPTPNPDTDPEPEYEDDGQQDEAEEIEEEGSNRGLVVVVVILLLAIVAVASYIAISMFDIELPKLFGSETVPTTSQTAPTTEPTTETTPIATGIACTELSISDVDIYLKSVGSIWKLTATPVPGDTTDAVVYTSSDENVVTVDEFGLVTAVGTGKASITVTCGDITVDCPVLCGEADEETTDPTDPTDPVEVPEDFVLKLKSKDFTLNKAGATYTLYDGEVDAAAITWSTDNEEVATIDKGVVTAVGNGRTRVYGELGDQKVSCWVSCKLPEEQTTEPADPTEPEETTKYAIRINGRTPNYGTEQAAEATISIGEELNIKIVDEAEKRVDVEWTVSGKGEVSIEGNTITGEKAGKVVLTAEINGQKLTCTFIVK